MTTATATPAPARLRFGQIVRYEGSIASERGGWFRVSGTRVYGDPGRYNLVPYFGKDGASPLYGARRESIVPVKITSYKCRECHLEHYIERGQPKGPCGLATLPDAVL
jgi:hypothetical protein